jgi:hypothetical protein
MVPDDAPTVAADLFLLFLRVGPPPLASASFLSTISSSLAALSMSMIDPIL